jgi:hypothetical protein
MAGAVEGQTKRILSKRHLKRDVEKGFVGPHLMLPRKETLFSFIDSAFRFLFLGIINAVP